MKRNYYSILLLILTFVFYFSIDASACECSWSGPFLKVSTKVNLIVRAEIIDHGPIISDTYTFHESMDIKILETLKGYTETQFLKIFGDPGYLCGVAIGRDHFKKGTQYFFALSRIKGYRLELSRCGEYWLEIDGKYAKGRKRKNKGKYKRYKVKLIKIREKFKTNEYL